jgi:hypothetical protein
MGKKGEQWVCEFCHNENVVDVEKLYIPTDAMVDIVKEEAKIKTKDTKKAADEDISVVFCVDTSGSMCVSEPVQGKFKLETDKTSELKKLMKFSDGSN